MSDKREPKAPLQFSQPIRQLLFMLIVIGLVSAGFYLGLDQITAIYQSNPYLNGVILGVFVLGVLSCFNQVFLLMNSVRWIERFARDAGGHSFSAAPSLLAPLATLLRSRGARTQVSSSSGRSILDSVAQRIDEDREITRYIGNVLIFLGLLGTFYGLERRFPPLLKRSALCHRKRDRAGLTFSRTCKRDLKASWAAWAQHFHHRYLVWRAH